MARTSLIFLFICFVCVTEFSIGYLIKGRSEQGVFTREIQVPKDEVLDIKLGLEQEVPLEVTVNKKCAEIGQFVSLGSILQNLKCLFSLNFNHLSLSVKLANTTICIHIYVK